MKGATANAAPIKGGRRSELSWLNLMFCFMVIWIHASSYAVVHLDPNSWEYALAYSLQQICFTSVYGFLFLSGLKQTLSNKKQTPILSLWGKRAKRILPPYCLAVAVYYFRYAVIQGYASLDLRTYLGFLVWGNLNAHFYFVVILAQFTLLAPLMRRLSEDCPPALILPAAVILTLLGGCYFNDIIGVFSPGAFFQYSDRLFTNYLVYYLAGCCMGQRYEKALAILEENKKLIVGCSVCAISFYLVLSWYGYALMRSIIFLGPAAMLHHLSAILLCFLIALRLPKELPEWLAAIDRASFLVYLYHMMAIQIADQFLDAIGITKTSIHFVLCALFVYTVTPLLCVLWQGLWGKIKKPRSA